MHVKRRLLLPLVSSVLLAFLLPAHGQTSATGARITHATSCMLKVLESVPGVSDAKLGEATQTGVARPYVQYHAAERYPGGQLVRFTLWQHNKGSLWFVAGMSGQVGPSGTIDIHVTDDVTHQWSIKCGVSANVLFN